MPQRGAWIIESRLLCDTNPEIPSLDYPSPGSKRLKVVHHAAMCAEAEWRSGSLLGRTPESVVSIHGPLGYGPSTLPLRHSASMHIAAKSALPLRYPLDGELV
ncbi:hypothetical protein LSAT2_032561 [Lamellibrachia satsuma]|nr:hypothetical protein LSAT2_032561 [Lamellibrachia satsuma]